STAARVNKICIIGVDAYFCFGSSGFFTHSYQPSAGITQRPVSQICLKNLPVAAVSLRALMAGGRVPFAQNGAHPHGTKFHRRPSGSKCRMRTLDRGATLKRPTDSGSVPPTSGTWSPIGWRYSQGGLYWEKRPHIS